MTKGERLEMEKEVNKINIIQLVNDFEIATEQRADFLYEFRTFIKDVTEQSATINKVQLRTNVKDAFERFGGNQELIINTINNFARSIIEKAKNKSFSNLLINLISNYMNALKFDIDKYLILYYANCEYWDNISAIEVVDINTIDQICSIYREANAHALENTSVIFGKTSVLVENLKIKTRNNYEKSIKAQKVSTFRNTLVAQCDEADLKGKARSIFINEKLQNYKDKL